MKLLYMTMVALLLAMPAMSMTDTQTAYLEGFQAGREITWLRFTDHAAYNIEVQKFNDALNESLNATEAAANQMEKFISPMEDYQLPKVFTAADMSELPDNVNMSERDGEFLGGA